MLVKCGALACKHCERGMCVAESIEIMDVEEKENIKFKDENFAVCKSFEFRN